MDNKVVNCFQNCILAYNSQRTDFGILQGAVVNCFQNCILAYNSQQEWIKQGQRVSCELLSKLYFSL